MNVADEPNKKHIFTEPLDFKDVQHEDGCVKLKINDDMIAEIKMK